MITKEELLQNRDKLYPSDYTPEIRENIDRLHHVMNRLRAIYGKPMFVTSGWRPPAVNASVGAPKSKHMLGLACDIADHDGELWKWLEDHMPLLKELGLFVEDPRWSPNWVHFQIVPPPSGKRIFIPYSNPAIHPMLDEDRWSGHYDHSLDD